MICQYLTNSHPIYLQMCANSIEMLRTHNPNVPVRVFLIEDEGLMTATTNASLPTIRAKGIPLSEFKVDAEVITHKPIAEGMFQVHKHLFKDLEEESILFIDCDTFIFGDVGVLFEKYKDYNFVGTLLPALTDWDENWLPFIPYNSAVCLWNDGWFQKFAEELPKRCQDIFDGNHSTSKWCFGKCSKATNREEMATSFFVEENNLVHTHWLEPEVKHLLCENDYYIKPTILHSWSHGWTKGYNKFKRKTNVKLLARSIR